MKQISTALSILTLAFTATQLGAQAAKKKPKPAVAAANEASTPNPPKESDLDIAKKVADKFILGVQSSTIPEGKAILQETAFPGIEFPVLIEQKTIMETMFETDIPQFQGFRRLMQVKVQSKAGTELSKQFVIVAYKQTGTVNWKVWEFREASDALANMAYFKDILDRKDYKYTNRSSELTHYAFWAVLAGKLTDAKQAYD